MPSLELLNTLRSRFAQAFGAEPTIVSFAPGRVETDYNEGFVLSAAIDTGTFFLVRPIPGTEIRLISHNLNDEVRWNTTDIGAEAESGVPQPAEDKVWSNYCRGVLVGLVALLPAKRSFTAFEALFGGDLPLGLGLSSSAALEVSTALALSQLLQPNPPPTRYQLAKIGQLSEHNYVGVKCGLLDQFSSLYGKAAHLVMSDFRSLQVDTVPLSDSICNTKVHHSLVDSEYNERRVSCETAAKGFASILSERAVTHLRDVAWSEWQQHHEKLGDKRAAARAAHIVGENDRVSRANQLLRQGKLAEFGALMYESHDSSRVHFENSCHELDVLVACAREVPEVYGARLSGGGFGGSAVVLVDRVNADAVSAALSQKYKQRLNKECDIFRVAVSDGAQVLQPAPLPTPPADAAAQPPAAAAATAAAATN